MKKETRIKVRAIENGTVIDHIEPGKAMRCLRLMNPRIRKPLYLGMNAESNKMNKKDFIKIEDYYPTEGETNRIALISQKATINTIKKAK